jgi:O-antigen ligase
VYENIAMKKPISILLSIFAVLLPFGTSVFDGIFRKQEAILCSCVLVSAILLAYIIFLTVTKKRISISVSVLDTGVLLFFVYSVLHLLFSKRFQAGEIVIYKWFAVLCIYVLCRIAAHKNMLMYAVVLSGFIQSIIAVLQKFYIIDSYSIFFDVTGSFNNPGRLGGYVAVAFTVAIFFLNVAVKNKSYPAILFLSISTLFLFAAVILSDSRAAFVGVLCGISVYLYPKFRFAYNKHKVVFTAICFTLAISVGLLLFNYRQGSANSRLLIWRVSADMILNKPLFGHGITAFDQKYMHYQAAYFAENPNSKFIPVADNVAYVYNEFIHITIETGITGLLCLLIIFYFTFSSKRQQLQKAALAVLLVFSMFSYPTEIFPLFILFPIIIGCLKTKHIKEIHLHRTIFAATGFALLLFIHINVKSNLYFRNASSEIMQTQENNRQMQEYIHKYYRRLKYNNEFCRIYILWTGKNISENEIFNVLELFPTSESYCIFGERYVQKGMYCKAEECFQTASLMTPNRILPNYGLFKLYQKSGNKEKAMLMANKILNQHIKIDNTQTIRMWFEVENYLKSTK